MPRMRASGNLRTMNKRRGMFWRLLRIDLFYVLLFNVIALVGTLLLSILVVFIPLAMVVALFNVVILSVLLLVRLVTMARIIDHSTRDL